MIIDRWVLCRFELTAGLAVLEFDDSGRIMGGSAAESFWSRDDSAITISNSRGEPTFRFSYEKGPSGELAGQFILPVAEWVGSKHFLRPLGNTHEVRCGLLPRQTDSLEEAADFARDRQDFSLILAPERHVVTEIENCILDGCDLRISPPFEYFSRKYVADEVFLNVLHDAVIINGNVVADRDGIVIGETLHQCWPKSDYFNDIIVQSQGKAYIHASKKSPVMFAGSHFLINTLLGNYGHWHMQSLCNIDAFRLAERLVKPENMKTLSLLGCGDEDFRRPSLEAFGFNPSSVIATPSSRGQSREQYDRLFVPSTLGIPSDVRFHPYLVTSLAALRRPKSKNGSRKIFVTRKDVDNRRGLLNSDELEARLNRLGFAAISMGYLGYESKLQAFADADMVVAPHGSGLTNMLAHDPGMKVYEMFHTYQLSPWFKNLAALCGHRYSSYCVNPPADEASKGWMASFKVDVDAVAQAVEGFLSS